MPLFDTNSRESSGRPKQDWRVIAVVWVIVGGVSILIAHTLAASLL